MDTHNPHHIRIFIQHIRLPIVHLVLFQLLDIAQEMKKTVIAGILKCQGTGKQHFHVSAALLAAGMGKYIVQISRIRANLLYQPVNGRVGGFLPVTREHRQKCLHPFL